jgi:acetyl esterase
MKKSAVVIFILLSASVCLSTGFEEQIRASFEPEPVPDEKVVYKTVDGKGLKVEIFRPANPQVPGKNPCAVMIHGGGWKGGTSYSFYRWSRYLAERGISVFVISYRLSNESKNITPAVCLEDVKSGVRWIRERADEFGIDPDRMVFCGSSAGGHLAAACATVSGFNAATDNLGTSCRPNLLLLDAPVIDNGPSGYGYDRVQPFWESFSPVHNLNRELPSTCVVMGDSDPLISLESVAKFGRAVEASGEDFKWYVVKAHGHGLFSTQKSNLTAELMEIFYRWHQFLAKHGYLEPPADREEESSLDVFSPALTEPLQVN